MTRLLGRSRLAKAWLGNTTLSKFNFIISEVKLYSAREKFLIFSRSPLTLAYVNKQLELIGIKALHFTSKVELRVREQYVTMFETSDTYRLPDGTEARCSSLVSCVPNPCRFALEPASQQSCLCDSSYFLRACVAGGRGNTSHQTCSPYRTNACDLLP